MKWRTKPNPNQKKRSYTDITPSANDHTKPLKGMQDAEWKPPEKRKNNHFSMKPGDLLLAIR
jgi:hypothetical protein